MPAYIIGGDTTLNLIVGNLKIDFSIQRHYYPFIQNANAAAQNSILYHSQTFADIEDDLMTFGDIFDQALQVPNINAAAIAALQGDYVVRSGRTWRVDNTNGNLHGPPNHCFPILGPNLWVNISPIEFAAAVALRKVEFEMERAGIGRESFNAKWRSLQLMTQPQRIDNSLWVAMNGARTHFRRGNLLDNNSFNKLYIVSGRGDLIKELVAISP